MTEQSGPRWRKSSYSGENNGDCVEVADGVLGTVPVRDSKVVEGPVVGVSGAAWLAFVRELKR
jgi:hypothetical protein